MYRSSLRTHVEAKNMFFFHSNPKKKEKTMKLYIIILNPAAI